MRIAKSKKATLISSVLSVLLLFVILSIIHFYVTNHIVLEGRDTIPEELDYCHFLQNLLDDSCGEGKIKVIPRTGREYVQPRIIEFKILDYSNDLEYTVQLLTDICNHYSLKYYSYVVYDNITKKQIILKEQQLKYVYKSDYYVIYMRLVLYVIKYGHYPRKIDELSNFTFYEKGKGKILNTSTYLSVCSMNNNNITIHQMQEECALSIIDTYPHNCTTIESSNGETVTKRTTDYTVILSDGKLLSLDYYRKRFVPQAGR